VSRAFPKRNDIGKTEGLKHRVGIADVSGVEWMLIIQNISSCGKNALTNDAQLSVLRNVVNMGFSLRGSNERM
jgi:hypothetical protein